MPGQLRKFVGPGRLGLALLVSVSILALLGWKTGVRVDAVGWKFRQANWGIVAGAAAFSALWHMFVGADKWYRILRALGVGVGYWEVFRVRMGSDPIRFATPFKMGEVANLVYFGRVKDSSFGRAAGFIVFDKALNLFGVVFWLYLGLAVMARLPAAGNLIIHSTAAAAVLVLICVRPVRQFIVSLARAIHPRLGKFISGALSAFETFSPVKKAAFLVYGVVFSVRELVVCWLLFMAFHLSRIPSVQEFLVYGSMVVLISMVPLTVAGIGARETAVTALFLFAGSKADLICVGLMMSLTTQVIPAVLGIPLMFPLLRSVMRVPDATGENAVEGPSAATVPTQIP